MVLHIDRLEIENSGSQVTETKEAVEVEVTPPAGCKFPQPGMYRTQNFPRVRANASQTRPSVRGEFQ